MRASVAAAVLLSAISAQAATHTVDVGLNGTLTFTPPSINVADGDTVIWNFHPKNHSLTQSSFAAPCTPLANGFTSGFMSVDPSATQIPAYNVTITNASAPLWFFCAQTNGADHCGNGMVFAINPTPEKTFQMFQAAANATLNSTSTNGTSTNGTSTASGTATSPTPTKSNAALRLRGGAAGFMTVAALLLGVTL